MEASRRQPGMLEGLSRFLVQHERCGAGFDVAHPAGLGSGRVSITCRGCGARHEYATATIEFERELKVEPADTSSRTESPLPPPPTRQPLPHPEPPSSQRRGTPIPPRPAPYPDSTRAEAPTSPAPTAQPPVLPPTAAPGPGAGTTPPSQGRAAGTARPRVAMGQGQPAGAADVLRRFWRSPRTTTVLLVVAAAALGFGVVRLVNGSGGSPSHSVPTTPSPPASVAPTAPTPPRPASGSPVPAQPLPSTTTIRTQRFTIQVPAGWAERASTGGLLLQPRGDQRVNVQVFFQRSPALSLTKMARQTDRFLRGEVPGATIFARRTPVGHELTARGPGETAVALDIASGPYRYLLLTRIYAGAKSRPTRAATQIVRSFNPN